MATIRLINTTKDHSKYASEEKKRAHSILLLIVTIGRLHCEFEVSGGGKVWLFYVIKGINSNHVGIISTYLISRPLLKFQTEIFIESKVFIWYLIWLINLMKQWIFEDFSKSYFISINFSTNLMTQLKLNLLLEPIISRYRLIFTSLCRTVTLNGSKAKKDFLNCFENCYHRYH